MDCSVLVMMVMAVIDGVEMGFYSSGRTRKCNQAEYLLGEIGISSTKLELS